MKLGGYEGRWFGGWVDGWVCLVKEVRRLVGTEVFSRRAFKL